MINEKETKYSTKLQIFSKAIYLYVGSSECASRGARHDQRINRTGSADIKVC